MNRYKGSARKKCIRPYSCISAVVKISFFCPQNVRFFNSKLGWAADSNRAIDCSLKNTMNIDLWGNVSNFDQTSNHLIKEFQSVKFWHLLSNTILTSRMELLMEKTNAMQIYFPYVISTTAVMAGNDTFQQKNITQNRKTLITQSKHIAILFDKI